jgi:cytochrome P450
MTHDEHLYKEPHAFEPQRFLDQDKMAPPPTTSIAFGFGRRYVDVPWHYRGSDCPSIRVCPGRELADASLWIICALTLATVNIGKSFGANGKELKPEDIAYTSTVIRWERIYKTSSVSSGH